MSEQNRSSLSDKLKSLGVQFGAADLKSSNVQNKNTLEKVLNAQVRLTHQGETLVVDEKISVGHPHGRSRLKIDEPMEFIADWAGDARVSQLKPESLAFLDTETTGLSGGTGTYAFLIGVGRFEGDEFTLSQFFLRDPVDEPAQLDALEEFLAPCEAIVTFNGKAFDIPLLYTRFTAHGWRSPFSGLAHLDLLHLARRLWRDRIPSRTLSNLEFQILGVERTEEDVPGWMIPSIYFDYLRDGDPRPLKRVFYHNAMDVISLAALLNHMAGLMADPINHAGEFSVDLIALARLFEDLGRLEPATRLYIQGLEHEDVNSKRLPKNILLSAIFRLAQIYKRQGVWDSAVELWSQAARYDHLFSYLELAKCYEHRIKDLNAAVQWTQSAIDLVENGGFQEEENPIISSYHRQKWLLDLNHRMERLKRKLSKIP